MRNYITLYFSLALLLLTSCADPGVPYKPMYSGSSNEVYIVIEDNFWESKSGELIQEELTKPVPGLPSKEPNLTLRNYPESVFGTLLQQHRNVIIVDIAGTADNLEPKINVKKSVWAKEQLVFEIKAATEEDFLKLFKDNSDRIIKLILEEDMLREQAKIIKQDNGGATAQLKQKHELSLNVPKGFELAKDESNFVWYRYNQQRFLQGGSGGYSGYHDVNQNIFIYYHPYLDTATFTGPWQLAMRDSMTKTYVPGPSDGSYMTTEREAVNPIVAEVELAGRYAMQINGLWKVEGAFMGGAFVSYSFYDEKRSRVVTVEGNVFAPQFNKRDYIRELQAVISTLTYE
jgi:hypothetical protein